MNVLARAGPWAYDGCMDAVMLGGDGWMLLCPDMQGALDVLML